MTNNMKTFAASIVPITNRLNASSLSQREITILKQTISDIIKKAGDLNPSGCSIAAYKKYQSLFQNEDIRDRTWHQQPRFDPGRRIFHREHCETVSTLRDLCIAENTYEGIVQILLERIRIVWILKSEDKVLTQNGHQSNRPEWKEAYQKAEIEVMPPIDGWPMSTD